MRRGWLASGIAAVLLTVAGCAEDGDDDSGAGTTLASPTSAPTSEPAPGPAAPAGPPAKPPPIRRLEKVNVALRPLADLPKLTAMATRPADGSMYFTSQTGEVWRLARKGRPQKVLDLRKVVSPYENGSERGLLGIAFHPVDGRLYLYYTDAELNSNVVSYAVDNRGRPRPRSRREVLFVEQPGIGHKGGSMAFTADGKLFVAFGDGGGSNGNDAQDYSKLLGSVIRIAPRPNRGGYRVPRGNPYVRRRGVRPEIWVKGLRNPWGLCFDQPTGNLWLADVGNHAMEEIDRIPAGTSGQNFGWPHVEGTEVRDNDGPQDVVAPVHAYRHDEVGPAAIGGCVYRGRAIRGLAGAYLFGDMSGPLFAMGRGDRVVRLPVVADGLLTGFGTDGNGEIVVLTLNKGAYRLVPG